MSYRYSAIVAGIVLGIATSTALANTARYDGTWEASDEFSQGPFAGGPVIILIQDVDATNRVLTAILNSSFDNLTGVCGNDLEVRVTMAGVLDDGVWRYSITSETPDGPAPDFPTFGVTGDVLSVTSATGAVVANSEINGDFINGPFCASIVGEGTITDEDPFKAGGEISLDLDVDGMVDLTLNATLTDNIVFKDSFELLN